MAQIRLLPPDVVNKIAAGEVVERPASVVKELVENALDAGASRVEIEIDDGGRGRIRVADDGAGMSRDDALLCLQRHATSKLEDAEGLFRIGTFGFRGEAVPAIASVARVTLTTREPDALEGTRIEIAGGELLGHGPAGAPRGTTVEVRDLFFATPARRKFLKRAETEAGHAAEAVLRLALCRPDVGFLLRSGGKVIFESPAGVDPRERVAAAIGKDVFAHLLQVEHRHGAVEVRGLAASPGWSTSGNRAIYTFVNGRFIRDRQLLHAIGRAYAGVLPHGRFPAAVLFLQVPEGEVDVNVHPQKLEVRFAEPRAVYDATLRALSEALRTTPWLEVASPAKAAPDGSPPQEGRGTRPGQAGGRGTRPGPAGSWGAGPGQTPFPGGPGQGGNQGPARLAGSPPQAPFSWNRGASPAGADPRQVAEALWPRPGDEALLGGNAAGDGRQPGYFSSLRIIGQLAQTYWVCEAPGSALVVVDQHAAHERLTFDRLRASWQAREAVGQPFLFPATVELGIADARALLPHLPELAAVGFELEPFGGTTFALKAVPAPLVGTDYARVLSDMARELATVGAGRALEDAITDMLATAACHASVRAHHALTPAEARALLDELDRIDFKSRCPHGRPVVAELPLAQLERAVGRR